MQMWGAGHGGVEIDTYSSGGTVSSPTDSSVNDLVFSLTNTAQKDANTYIVSEWLSVVTDVSGDFPLGRQSFSVGTSQGSGTTGGLTIINYDYTGRSRIGPYPFQFLADNAGIGVATDSTLTIENAVAVTGVTTHVIRAGAGQSTTHLTEWQNVSKSVLAYVGSDGGASIASLLVAGKSLTLSGNLTTTGAFNPTFAIPSSSTWTFPSGGGTLVASSGAVTSIAGTLNQITASAATGAVTLSIPTNPIFSGTALTFPGALSIASGKTLTASNTITITATDGITMTTPTTSFTAARTDAANTFTGNQSITGTLQITSTTNPQISVTNGANTSTLNGSFGNWTSGGEVRMSNLGVSGQIGIGTIGAPDVLIVRGGAAATAQFGVDVNGAAVSQTLQAANGITGTNVAGGNITIQAGKGTGTGAISSVILRSPTLGTTGTTAQVSDIRLTLNQTSATFVPPVLSPYNQTTTLYSAAGTALPTCNGGLEGARASVSDATLPTFLGAYVSGGAVHAAVYCDGTSWKTD